MTGRCIFIFWLSFVGVINSFSFMFNFGSIFHSSFNFTRNGLSTSSSSNFNFGGNSSSSGNSNFAGNSSSNGNSNSGGNSVSDSDTDGLKQLEKSVGNAFSEFNKLFSDIPAELTTEVESSLKDFDKSVADMFGLLRGADMNSDKQFLAEACCLKSDLRDAIKKGFKLIADLIDAGDMFLRFPMEGFTSTLKTLLSQIVNLQTELSTG